MRRVGCGSTFLFLHVCASISLSFPSPVFVSRSVSLFPSLPVSFSLSLTLSLSLYTEFVKQTQLKSQSSRTPVCDPSMSSRPSASLGSPLPNVTPSNELRASPSQTYPLPLPLHLQGDRPTARLSRWGLLQMPN